MMRFAAAVTATLTVLGIPALGAQRLNPSAANFAVGVLHRQDQGLAVAASGSYVVSSRILSLSLTPVDLALTTPNDRYEFRTTAPGGPQECRDQRNSVTVDRGYCVATVHYAASVQLLGLFADSLSTLGLGLGYRVFDVPGPFAALTLDFGKVRDARLQFRGRVGGKFYDLALGATIAIPSDDRAPSPASLIRSVGRPRQGRPWRGRPGAGVTSSRSSG